MELQLDENGVRACVSISLLLICDEQPPQAYYNGKGLLGFRGGDMGEMFWGGGGGG